MHLAVMRYDTSPSMSPSRLFKRPTGSCRHQLIPEVLLRSHMFLVIHHLQQAIVATTFIFLLFFNSVIESIYFCYLSVMQPPALQTQNFARRLNFIYAS